jgi:hypothetical protein
MVELSWMLIIKLACIQALRFQEQMLKSCLGNGNSKLDLVKEFQLEITYGLLDTYLVELQKTSMFQLLYLLSSSESGMVLVVIQTSPLFR